MDRRPRPILDLALALALALALVLTLFPSAASASASAGGGGGVGAATSISLGRLSWDADITLLGAASLANGTLSLTPAGSLPAGRALYSRPVRFLDPATRRPASFATRFAFSILPSSPAAAAAASSPAFGDGLAFLLTSDPRFLGSPHGFFGLFSSSDADKNQSPVTVAVEFDTNLDPPLRDADDNHVAVDAGSIFSTASAPAPAAGVDLKAGLPMTAWVDYRAPKKALRVWLAYSPHSRPPRPLLAATLDLSPLLREFMFVGFSASQGPAAALHLVRSWTFRTFGFGPEGAGDEFPNPQDDHAVAPPAPDPPPPPPSPPRRTAIHIWLRPVVVVVVVVVVAAGFLFLFLTPAGLWRRHLRCGNNKPAAAAADDEDDADDGEPWRIPLDEIRSATGGFDGSKILGQEGGSGGATVYRGVLPSGTEVAVKRFVRRAEQNFAGALAAELAAVVGGRRHRNLVPLAGWCCEKDELVLVYEFLAPHGTLDRALHSTDHAAAAAAAGLSWGVRKNIVLGVASALAFLHDECGGKMVHRDVKACNILLDADFGARLGDFGLALAPPGGGGGGIGYAAPEYAHSGVATEESDVYSFGVVVLEVATGRRPVDRGVVLADWVWELWGRRRIADAADPRLEGRFGEEEMARMLIVGLGCTHPDSKRRPRMKKAVRMLQGTAPLPSLPALKPAVRLLSQLPQASSTSTSAAAAAAPPDSTCSRSSGDAASTAYFSCG